MRLRRPALAVTVAAIALSPVSVVAATASAASPSTTASSSSSGDGWQRVYRNDFTDLRDVSAFQSSTDTNNALRPSDSSNSPLQKPSLRSNVVTVGDRGAEDGKSMAVYTRQAHFNTGKGTQHGWTNGRMMIRGQNEAPPVRIKTRLRMTASAKAKSAVMWWPAGGGWPWEVDFVESFGGNTTKDYWGSRQNITQRWHADLNGDGRAIEQLIKDMPLDATKYHVYDLFVTPSRMWIEIDGVKRFETTDRRFIPKGPGFFSVGKALTHRRDAAGRTEDAVVVDYVEIYKQGKASAAPAEDARLAEQRVNVQTPEFSKEWFSMTP